MNEKWQSFNAKQIVPGERFGAYLIKGRSPLVHYGNRDGVAAINEWDEIAERALQRTGILPALLAYVIVLGRRYK